MDRFDTIPYADLSPESSWTRLGKGSFGCVYKGEYLGIEVAIKEVMASGEYDVDKYFQREVKVMQEARHPNIVQYLGLCKAPAPAVVSPFPLPGGTPQRILIVSEYLSRGNLRSYIYQTHLPFPWRLRVSFAIDVARAVAYLHARQCMHRDLKGENLLVTENERIKICDFGFARIAARNDDEMRRISYCGTDGYMAPEILIGNEFGLSADIFSLGVIFVEIITRILVDGSTFARQLPSFGISVDEIKSSLSPYCPDSFVNLTLACLSIEPSSRPQIREILDSLRKIEFEILEMESRGVGLNPHDNRGTWNVGSVSFAGTTRRGKGGKSRPGAPRLPSFEGSVKLGGRKSDESDEDDLAALREAEVTVEGATIQDGGLLQSDTDYSTSVVRASSMLMPSELTIRGFSRTKQHGHDRLASNSSSLPSLPNSWLLTSPLPSSEDIGDPGLDSSTSATTTPDQSAPPTPELAQQGDDEAEAEDDRTKASFLTARTLTPSICAATVDHHSSSSSEEDDEAWDVFHSTIGTPIPQTSLADSTCPLVVIPALHRFSLVKPKFQRFIVSLGGGGGSERSSSTERKNSGSKDKRGSVDWVQGVTAKCALCEKRLGMLKAYLECDECGFCCHIKCSDMCPPGCNEPLIPVATTPLTPSVSTPSRIPPSKLLKKRPKSTSTPSSTTIVVT